MDDGDVFSDASLLDGAVGLGRTGWAFTVLERGTSNLVGSAYGVPPRWINTVPKTEAWAVLMAARALEFISNQVTLDCMSVLNVLRGGRIKATQHNNPLARLWRKVFPYFDGENVDDRIRWMPAHKGKEGAGKLKDSRGEVLSLRDIDANEAVDLLAKAAVEEHRVSEDKRKLVVARDARVRLVAYCIGMAATQANQTEEKGGRDSRPRFGGEEKQHGQGGNGHERQIMRAKPRMIRHLRSVQAGGHRLVMTGNSWECLVCRCKAKRWNEVAHQMCKGSVAEKWARHGRALACSGQFLGTDGAGHIRYLTDNTVWCDRCGATATHHAIRLSMPCEGKARAGGAQHNLKMLRKGFNPITKQVAKEGPYPEPGLIGKPRSGEEEDERWGTKGYGVWKGRMAERLKPKSEGGLTARQRLDNVRKRVRERLKPKEGGGLTPREKPENVRKRVLRRIAEAEGKRGEATQGDPEEGPRVRRVARGQGSSGEVANVKMERRKRKRGIAAGGASKRNSVGDIPVSKRYKRESGPVAGDGRAKRRRLRGQEAGAAKKCRTVAVP